MSSDNRSKYLHGHKTNRVQSYLPGMQLTKLQISGCQFIYQAHLSYSLESSSASKRTVVYVYAVQIGALGKAAPPSVLLVCCC